MTTDLETPLRQRLTLGLHLSNDPAYPAVTTVWPATSGVDGSDIAVVEIVDGLRVQSDDADILRTVARAFEQAAASIEALA